MRSNIVCASVLSELIVGISCNAKIIGLFADEIWHRVLVGGKIGCGVVGGTETVVLQCGLNSKQLA